MEANRNEERLSIIKKIEEYERDGRFDEDVENDPPSRTILPNEVDYTKKLLKSKIKARFAYFIARRYLNKITKKKQFIVKEIKGIENYNSLTSGAIITCNHFNALDSFAMQVAYEKSNNFKKRKFYRVIREGNYTSFPGFFGYLMRNCYTLPLSSNMKTMASFLTAVHEILTNGDLILVYAEQSMWWNYKKPKPLKKSAFQMAVKASVPVLPCFITMQDSNILDADGFYVQEYTINIGKPIYPNKNESLTANISRMINENEKFCKEIYEDFYKVPLSYK